MAFDTVNTTPSKFIDLELWQIDRYQDVVPVGYHGFERSIHLRS